MKAGIARFSASQISITVISRGMSDLPRTQRLHRGKGPIPVSPSRGRDRVEKTTVHIKVWWRHRLTWVIHAPVTCESGPAARFAQMPLPKSNSAIPNPRVCSIFKTPTKLPVARRPSSLSRAASIRSKGRIAWLAPAPWNVPAADRAAMGRVPASSVCGAITKPAARSSCVISGRAACLGALRRNRTRTSSGLGAVGRACRAPASVPWILKFFWNFFWNFFVSRKADDIANSSSVLGSPNLDQLDSRYSTSAALIRHQPMAAGIR